MSSYGTVKENKTYTKPIHPINLEIKLIEEEQDRIRQEINNLKVEFPQISNNDSKEERIHKNQLNEKAHEARDKKTSLQGYIFNLDRTIWDLRLTKSTSNLAPSTYYSRSINLAAKHRYLASLDLNNLPHLSTPIISKDDWFSKGWFSQAKKNSPYIHSNNGWNLKNTGWSSKKSTNNSHIELNGGWSSKKSTNSHK